MGAWIRLGLVAVVLAIAWQLRGGVGDVEGALRQAGWLALAVITLYHLVPMSLCGLAWGSLAPVRHPAFFVVARWVRDGVGELAAFLPLSGEIAAARLLTRRGGLRLGMAGAMTVVDLTAEVMSQFLFTLLGVGLWLTRHPESEVLHWAEIGLAASVPVLITFVVVQRSLVMRFLETLPARLMPKTWQAPDADAGIHAAIRQIYGDRPRLIRAVGLHLAAWLTSTAEAWIALRFLGHPLAIWDVLALESIIYAIRSAVFFVPAGLGFQEGGYVMVCAALGLPPEVALAVSLLKRGREVLLGVPALLAWHFLDDAR